MRCVSTVFGLTPSEAAMAFATAFSPWKYDQAMYRRHNEIERLFRRLKGFRRIFSRFDKLEVMFIALINFALIVEALR